jgi:anaerobic ribonucleoside-triphosphate reductase activating protein
MDTRYVNIKESYGSDGLGFPSISIYFSHCDKEDITGYYCKGCHNKELQEDGFGFNLSLQTIIKITEQKLEKLKTIFGSCSLVLLGGEPTSNINIEFVKSISEYFYRKYKIIMYTWKELEMLNENDIKFIDEIICGQYIESFKVSDYILPTSNQYIINNKKEIIKKYGGQ